MVTLSAFALTSFIHSGLGGALITAVGRASGSTGIGSIEKIEKVAVVGTVLGSGCGILAVVAGQMLVWIIPWSELWAIPSGMRLVDVRLLFGMIVICLAIGFAALTPKYVMVGMRRGYVVFTADIVGLCVSAALLFRLIHLGAPMWALGLGFILPQYLISFGTGLYALRLEGIRCWKLACFRKDMFLTMGSDAARFALQQVTHALATHTDQLMVGSIAGLSASASYGIAQRLFSAPVQLAAVVNQALWPELSRADAAGRSSWVLAVFARALATMLLFATTASVFLFVFYEEIVRLWLGVTNHSQGLLTLGMSAWIVTTLAANTADTLLRALNQTKFLVYTMTAMMLTNLVLTFFLVHAIGSAGAIWATVIAYTVCLLVPYSFAISRYRRASVVSSTQ
ncbi:MAG: polysaccharide biosynthesis C-terminal domain-containing protein [Myxococcota bacterium]